MGVLVLVACIGIALSPLPLLGQEAGIALGLESGFGAFGRAGSEAVKVEGAAGFTPVISVVTTQLFINGVPSLDETSVDFYFPLQLGARVSFRVSDPDADNRLAVRAGGSYNTLLKAGFGGGVDYGISEKMTLAAALMVFPDAPDELKKKFIEDGVADPVGGFLDPDDISISEFLTKYQLVLGLAIRLL